MLNQLRKTATTVTGNASGSSAEQYSLCHATTCEHGTDMRGAPALQANTARSTHSSTQTCRSAEARSFSACSEVDTKRGRGVTSTTRISKRREQRLHTKCSVPQMKSTTPEHSSTALQPAQLVVGPASQPDQRATAFLTQTKHTVGVFAPGTAAAWRRHVVVVPRHALLARQRPVVACVWRSPTHCWNSRDACARTEQLVEGRSWCDELLAGCWLLVK